MSTDLQKRLKKLLKSEVFTPKISKERKDTANEIYQLRHNKLISSGIVPEKISPEGKLTIDDDTRNAIIEIINEDDGKAEQPLLKTIEDVQALGAKIGFDAFALEGFVREGESYLQSHRKAVVETVQEAEAEVEAPVAKERKISKRVTASFRQSVQSLPPYVFTVAEDKVRSTAAQWKQDGLVDYKLVDVLVTEAIGLIRKHRTLRADLLPQVLSRLEAPGKRLDGSEDGVQSLVRNWEGKTALLKNEPVKSGPPAELLPEDKTHAKLLSLLLRDGIKTLKQAAPKPERASMLVG